jgi:hypothetical protein
MLKINRLDDGAFDTCVHLPIADLLMDGLTCLEYTDPETKNRLTIKQTRYDDAGVYAAEVTAELCVCTDSQKVWHDLLWIQMPEPLFQGLFSRWSSELKEQTSAQIKIAAVVPKNRKKAPATVEYTWSDQQKTDRTS